MHELDRYYTVFDESVIQFWLSHGFHYEAHKQQNSGFENLGELGRTFRAANHALVLMIRGLRKWKQVIAYYFTNDTILSSSLKRIITNVIVQLQQIGLKGKACLRPGFNSEKSFIWIVRRK